MNMGAGFSGRKNYYLRSAVLRGSLSVWMVFLFRKTVFMTAKDRMIFSSSDGKKGYKRKKNGRPWDFSLGLPCSFIWSLLINHQVPYQVRSSCFSEEMRISPLLIHFAFSSFVYLLNYSFIFSPCFQRWILYLSGYHQNTRCFQETYISVLQDSIQGFVR